MEFPLPKWMEFVVLGILIIPCAIAIFIVDRFQKPPEELDNYSKSL
jgi:hypothetical protein